MIGSVEPSKTYNIVPGARTSRSSVLCPGGELRRLIDELLPTRAVLRELGPLLEVRCNACPRERLGKEYAVCCSRQYLDSRNVMIVSI